MAKSKTEMVVEKIQSMAQVGDLYFVAYDSIRVNDRNHYTITNERNADLDEMSRGVSVATLRKAIKWLAANDPRFNQRRKDRICIKCVDEHESRRMRREEEAKVAKRIRINAFYDELESLGIRIDYRGIDYRDMKKIVNALKAQESK